MGRDCGCDNPWDASPAAEAFAWTAENQSDGGWPVVLTTAGAGRAMRVVGADGAASVEPLTDRKGMESV